MSQGLFPSVCVQSYAQRDTVNSVLAIHHAESPYCLGGGGHVPQVPNGTTPLVKRSPKVVRKETALALNAPWDSTAIGWKIYELVRLIYFVSLRLATRSAAALADRAEDNKYEAWSYLSVLNTVTSQVKGLPPCQVINVRPSGLLPSSLVKTTGSFVTGIPADCMAGATTWFNAWCLIILLGACLQTKPWSPWASINDPHPHYYYYYYLIRGAVIVAVECQYIA